MKSKVAISFSLLLSICIDSSAQNELWGMTYSGGAHHLGNIFKTNEDGSLLTVQYSFPTNFAGAGPTSEVTEMATGELYGVTYGGGKNSIGVIFKYDPSTSIYTSMVDFERTTKGASPYGRLIVSNGKLYGLTTSGGANNEGVLFEFDPSTTTYTKKYDFGASTGRYPEAGLTPASNGKLYSVASSGGFNDKGVIFEYDPTINSYAKKIDFDGTNGATPRGDLCLASNGKFYGMTNNGGASDLGVIFEYDPSDNSFNKRLDFDGSTKGSNPRSHLVQHSNGKLYGLTFAGGANSYGVLFEFNPADFSYEKKFDLNGTTRGGSPYGGLEVGSNGKLYGMTYVGNNSGEGNGFGILFEYDPLTNTFTTKKGFGGSSGFGPQGSLTLTANGKLFGMTGVGGLNNNGTLFEYDPTSGAFVKKVDFNYAPNGSNPTGNLTQTNDGKFFGMTTNGGIYGEGVLFEFDPVNMIFTKKVDFEGSESGSRPNGSLILSSDNKLYGMTIAGGTFNKGALFEYDPTTNILEKKANFSGTDNGQSPYGDLTVASNGKFYGLTYFGGLNNVGVIFEYDPATSTLTRKYSFTPSDGSNPYGSFIAASNGKLYSTTQNGGANSLGVIFEYDPTANEYNKKFDFDGTTSGSAPFDGLTEASSDKLYGMTLFGGANSKGVLYEYTISSSGYSKKLNFDYYTYGANPSGRLTMSSNGKLYGLTRLGGSSEAGVLFEFDPSTFTPSKKIDFDKTDGREPHGSLVYRKDMQTITFNTLPEKTYGDNSFDVSAISTSGLPTTFTSSDLSIAYITGNTINILKAGVVTITAHQSGNKLYLSALDVPQSLTINKAMLSASADDLTKTYGADNPTLTIQYSGFIGSDNVNSLATQPEISCSATKFSDVGNYEISLTGGSDNNYIFSFINGTLEITKATITATADDKARQYGTDNPAFTFTYTGLLGDNTSNDIDTPPMAETDAIQFSAVGIYSIVATGGLDNNYIISLVNGTLTITKAEQSIQFTVPDKLIDSPPFTLSAVASSGLPVTFSTTSTKVTLATDMITLLAPGRVTISASQVGNESYHPETVDRSFCIIPLKPSITSTNPSGVYPILLSSSETGNQWYFNGNVMNGSTDTALEAIFSGTYQVQASVDDCQSEISNEFPVVITGDLLEDENVVLYPNPSQDYFFVNGIKKQIKKASIIDVLGRQRPLSLMEEKNAYMGDIRHLSSGTYIVRIVENSKIHNLRIVKK